MKSGLIANCISLIITIYNVLAVNILIPILYDKDWIYVLEKLSKIPLYLALGSISFFFLIFWVLEIGLDIFE